MVVQRHLELVALLFPQICRHTRQESTCPKITLLFIQVISVPSEVVSRRGNDEAKSDYRGWRPGWKMKGGTSE